MLNTLYKSKNDLDKETSIPINHLAKENNTIVISDDKNGEFLFYQNNSPLSLFLVHMKSMFAEEGNIDLADLNFVLNEYNEKVDDKRKIDLTNLNVKEFFLGNFSETKFEDGQFHKLFKTKEGRDTINKFISILNPNKSKLEPLRLPLFKNAAASLFSALDPKKYGNPVFSEQLSASTEYDKNSIVNIKAKQILDVKEHVVYNGETRNLHYNEPISFTTTNTSDPGIEALNFLNANIKLGVDIIKLPKSDKFKEGKWVIPTRITAGPTGIKIAWAVSDLSGTTIFGTDTIPIKSKKINIEYRKFESKLAHLADVSDLSPEEMNADGNVIVNLNGTKKEEISSAIAKKFIERGSYITYVTSKGNEKSAYVQTVYPGMIVLNTTFKDVHNKIYNFKGITSIRSTKLNSIDYVELKPKDLTGLVTINENSGKIANTGDIITSIHKGKSRINKVIDADTDNVYILINYKDGMKVDTVKRTDITSLSVPKVQLSITESKSFLELHDKINKSTNSIKEQNYSSFQDSNIAQNGDFIVTKDNEVYKIIDKDSSRVVQSTGTMIGATAIIDLKNPELTFYTIRQIASPYSLNTVVGNSRNLTISNDAGISPEEDAKLGYSQISVLMPKTASIENLDIINETIPNMGVIVENSYLLKYPTKYEDYVDITPQVLAKINEKSGGNIKRILTKEKSIEKQLIGLFPVYGFKKADASKKEEYLNVGGYLKLNYYGNTDPKLYRINAISGDSVTVEYNSYSHEGKLLTISKNIPKSILFGDQTNSIMEYYWIKGNSKIDNFLKEKEYKNEKKKLAIPGKTILTEFVDHLKNVFSQYNMNITIDQDGKGFKSGEYAKIQNGEIVINGKNASREHVLHEYLHVFLINLKYGSKESNDNYENILLSFKKQNPDISGTTLDTIEENFIDRISKALVEKEDFPKDIDEFLELLVSQLGKMDLVVNEKNIKSSVPIDILNIPIESLLPQNFNEKNGLYKKSITLFETEFRH